jgi:DNA polymerase III subunit epsilon
LFLKIKKRTLISLLKFAVVDIETTGATNKITDVAVVFVDDGVITGSWSSLVNPREFLPNNIIWLTGITQDMVDNAPLFEDIADDLFEATKDRIFVAHSVAFDYGIIKNHFQKLNIAYNRNRVCTVRLSRSIIPGHQSYSLGKICPVLGINNHARHRALGDAEATAELLQILIKNDREDHIKKALNKQSREAMMPPALAKSVFDELPTAAGVYRFIDQKGTVIYVGKAINIKSRIAGHFADNGTIKGALKNEIASINYTLTGSEFLAYLIEANDIKKYFPKYNKAAKYATNAFGYVVYPSQSGKKHINIAKKTGRLKLKGSFSSNMQARDFLKLLVTEHQLCPIMCGLQKVQGCEHCEADGNCMNNELSHIYNQKVDEALTNYWMVGERIICFLKGRNANEKAFIIIENGEYRGYGFVAKPTLHTDSKILKDAFVRQINYSEITRILINQIDSNDVLEINALSFEIAPSQSLSLSFG